MGRSGKRTLQSTRAHRRAHPPWPPDPLRSAAHRGGMSKILCTGSGSATDAGQPKSGRFAPRDFPCPTTATATATVITTTTAMPFRSPTAASDFLHSRRILNKPPTFPQTTPRPLILLPRQGALRLFGPKLGARGKNRASKRACVNPNGQACGGRCRRLERRSEVLRRAQTQANPERHRRRAHAQHLIGQYCTHSSQTAGSVIYLFRGQDVGMASWRILFTRRKQGPSDPRTPLRQPPTIARGER